MATIINTDYTSIEPITLEYNFFRNEPLKAQYIGYSEGLNLYNLNALKNFQDVTISKNSCFILTSSIGLSSFFYQTEDLKVGQIPGTLKLQPQTSNTSYLFYSKETNTFIATEILSSIATNLNVFPVSNKPFVEILVDNKYVQIDESYPFTVRLGEKINEPNLKYRQEFYCETYYNRIALKVYTKDNNFPSGYRYLALGNDNTLRATGVILNTQLVNNFLFKTVFNSTNTLTYNFNPDNNWITYFLDFPSQAYNKDVSLNKVFSNLETNFLVDFPIEPATKSGYGTLNFANLKTGLTPTGNPPEIDNSYNEQIITTN